MHTFDQGLFTGERALYHLEDARITNSVFQDGESPLKESRNIEVRDSIFRWKYPLWYAKHIRVENSTLLETARSGIWYTHDLVMDHCTIEAPKTFRRCSDVTLNHCTMPLAQESFWGCSEITLNDVTARGDYYCMNTRNVTVDHLNLTGNYCFDGATNVVVRNSKLISKDSFWNTENVEIYDSYIVGEYLAWNSRHVKLVNCTIESNQGLNYIEDLELINCRLIHTDLAFEFVSDVKADIDSHIDSVKNPISGSITCRSIGELIMDPDLIDPNKTVIIAERIDLQSDKGEERRGQLF